MVSGNRIIIERADAAAAWRRHFQTAAFLLERGIVPAVLERLSDIDRPDDLARAAGVSSPRVIFDASISRALRPPLAAHAMANTMEVRQRIVEPSRQSTGLPRKLP